MLPQCRANPVPPISGMQAFEQQVFPKGALLEIENDSCDSLSSSCSSTSLILPMFGECATPRATVHVATVSEEALRTLCIGKGGTVLMQSAERVGFNAACESPWSASESESHSGSHAISNASSSTCSPKASSSLDTEIVIDKASDFNEQEVEPDFQHFLDILEPRVSRVELDETQEPSDQKYVDDSFAQEVPAGEITMETQDVPILDLVEESSLDLFDQSAFEQLTYQTNDLEESSQAAIDCAPKPMLLGEEPDMSMEVLISTPPRQPLSEDHDASSCSTGVDGIDQQTNSNDSGSESEPDDPLCENELGIRWLEPSADILPESPSFADTLQGWIRCELLDSKVWELSREYEQVLLASLEHFCIKMACKRVELKNQRRLLSVTRDTNESDVTSSSQNVFVQTALEEFALLRTRLTSADDEVAELAAQYRNLCVVHAGVDSERNYYDARQTCSANIEALTSQCSDLDHTLDALTGEQQGIDEEIARTEDQISTVEARLHRLHFQRVALQRKNVTRPNDLKPHVWCPGSGVASCVQEKEGTSRRDDSRRTSSSFSKPSIVRSASCPTVARHGTRDHTENHKHRNAAFATEVMKVPELLQLQAEAQALRARIRGVSSIP